MLILELSLIVESTQKEPSLLCMNNKRSESVRIAHKDIKFPAHYGNERDNICS